MASKFTINSVEYDNIQEDGQGGVFLSSSEHAQTELTTTEKLRAHNEGMLVAHSTCAECGLVMESGRTRRCEYGGWCSHYVPRFLSSQMDKATKLLHASPGHPFGHDCEWCRQVAVLLMGMAELNLEQYVTGSTSTVRVRQRKEVQIAATFVTVALAAGYSISVNSANADKYRTTLSEVLGAMFSMYEDKLVLYKSGGVYWCHFVYGNDGHDVIGDYTIGLESLIEEGPVAELVERLGG